MQIILREDIDNLGKQGEVVNVAAGYARNYLLRRKLAMPATPGNLKTFEVQKEALALREQKDKSDAEVVAAELEKWEAVISRKAGESGALFGSVTSANVVELLAAKGINIDRRKILLREPLKALGAYKILIRLHREVTVEFPLYVVGETQRENEGIQERRAAPPVEEVKAETPAPAPAEDRGEERGEKKGKREKKARAEKEGKVEKDEKKERKPARKRKESKAKKGSEE